MLCSPSVSRSCWALALCAMLGCTDADDAADPVDDAGSATFACELSSDCSHNGECDEGQCRCDSGWSGLTCSRLQLGPADVDGGFRPDNQDSWGGALLKGDDGLFHMWVSVVANGCNIDLWARNSMTVYATATDPMGPYQWKNEAFPVMSHEIDVKRAPDGTYVAFVTAGLDDEGYVAESDLGEACQCDETTGTPTEPCQTAASTERSVMVTAKSPAGPWSKATVLLDPKDLDDGIDANFSADILPDGRLIGLWRTYPANQAGRGASVVHWVIAKDYRDPSTYEWQSDKESLFAAPRDGSVAEGLEDMFVWYDNQRKVAHALFHDMIEREDGVSFDALGHAWSTDGKSWTYTGMAADNQVPLSDGSQTTSARARPHGLVIDGKLTHLSFAENALINGRNYTMVQAVQSSAP